MYIKIQYQGYLYRLINRYNRKFERRHDRKFGMIESSKRSKDEMIESLKRSKNEMIGSWKLSKVRNHRKSQTIESSNDSHLI